MQGDNVSTRQRLVEGESDKARGGDLCVRHRRVDDADLADEAVKPAGHGPPDGAETHDYDGQPRELVALVSDVGDGQGRVVGAPDNVARRSVQAFGGRRARQLLRDDGVVRDSDVAQHRQAQSEREVGHRLGVASRRVYDGDAGAPAASTSTFTGSDRRQPTISRFRSLANIASSTGSASTRIARTRSRSSGDSVVSASRTLGTRRSSHIRSSLSAALVSGLRVALTSASIARQLGVVLGLQGLVQPFVASVPLEVPTRVNGAPLVDEHLPVVDRRECLVPGDEDGARQAGNLAQRAHPDLVPVTSARSWHQAGLVLIPPVATTKAGRRPYPSSTQESIDRTA